MARPKKVSPTRKVSIYFDAALADKIDLLLYDSFQHRVPYEAWRNLLEPMLRDWLERRVDPSIQKESQS